MAAFTIGPYAYDRFNKRLARRSKSVEPGRPLVQTPVTDAVSNETVVTIASRSPDTKLSVLPGLLE